MCYKDSSLTGIGTIMNIPSQKMQELCYCLSHKLMCDICLTCNFHTFLPTVLQSTTMKIHEYNFHQSLVFLNKPPLVLWLHLNILCALQTKVSYCLQSIYTTTHRQISPWHKFSQKKSKTDVDDEFRHFCTIL